VVKVARNEKRMFGRGTILFMDEVHRFNKLQQDAFLPHVEDGTITLIGATTENPSFSLNSALLSRCKVIVLDKLSKDSLAAILKRAVEATGGKVVTDAGDDEDEKGEGIQKEALDYLASITDGDARTALNGLQVIVMQLTDQSYRFY
jgi:putative ATPase